MLLARQMQSELARRHLLDFACAIHRGYQVGRHHERIAAALGAVANGEIDRLIIECPPRHGKSLLASILFPAWYLGTHPDNRIIACAYNTEFATRFSRKARNLLASPGYQAIFPAVQLAQDSRSMLTWELAPPHYGGYDSAGIGAGVTGKGANVLLIDDPIKSAEEAGSAAVLENIWEWYTQEAYTRLEGRGAVVLIMTRWADADLTGRLLRAAQDDPTADQWQIVHLPALAEDDDQLGRAPGEALWPEKFPADLLHSIQSNIGSRAFAGLFQQRPAPLEGNLFKHGWWQYYDRAQPFPAFKRIVQYWDTAYKDKQENDFSACVTMALTDDHRFFLLDAVWRKLEFPQLVAAIQQQYEKWAAVPGCRPAEVCIEDKASGTSAYQTLRATTTVPVLALPVERDKVARANAVTAYYESGRVLHPAGAPWLAEYELTMERFPTDSHDDVTDATTGALARLAAKLARHTTVAPVSMTRQSVWRSI